MHAILLDRDGVINCERADYVKSWHEFHFLPGVLPALRRLATLAVPIAVITNQSAIGRGIIEPATVAEIHNRLRKTVFDAGGRLDAFFVCPHHPSTGCGCRKPKPGLLVQAAEQLDFSLKHSVFIGDTITDFEAARAAGCHAILVKSGLQGIHLDQLFSDIKLPPPFLPPPIVEDLSTAVDLLVHDGLNRPTVLSF